MYSTQTKETVLVLIFTIVAIASGADLVADFSHGADTEHMLKEAIIVSISMSTIAWLLLGLRQQRLEIKALRQELETANRPQTTPRKYVLEVRKKLGSVVTQQFSEWMLTGSEIEVGWLLLARRQTHFSFSSGLRTQVAKGHPPNGYGAEICFDQCKSRHLLRLIAI